MLCGEKSLSTSLILCAFVAIAPGGFVGGAPTLPPIGPQESASVLDVA
jgi:hypothetical protein